jgi:MFS family permease
MNGSSGLKRGQVAGAAIGNALEFYDFLAFSFFAVQIGRAFFPSTDPNASLLAALATFGVGFLMRPVGALVVGRLADRVGRKPAMVLSISLMGLSMGIMAIIPPYTRIGVWAGILAVACRMLQGFALGGEIGPSTALLVESAPPGHRTLYTGFQFASQQIGVIASGVVGVSLANALPDAAMDAWGWRVAFLIGLAILPFGLYLRSRLTETLVERPAPAAPTPGAKAPATPGLVLVAILGLLLLAGGTTVNYLSNYMTTYATHTLHMPTSLGFAATLAVGIGGLSGGIVGGMLGDRFGRRLWMILPCAFLVIALAPMFMGIVATRAAYALLGASAAFAFANVMFSTNVLAEISQRLPQRIRGQSLGLIYAVSISVFGGSTQFIVAWLTIVTKSPLAPAWYATAALAISLGAMMLLPKGDAAAKA